MYAASHSGPEGDGQSEPEAAAPIGENTRVRLGAPQPVLSEILLATWRARAGKFRDGAFKNVSETYQKPGKQWSRKLRFAALALLA